MQAQEKKIVLKCWSQRLWWIFLLAGLVSAYFVLRGFALNYWSFLGLLTLFLGAGASIGHFLGTYIDNHHRSDKGLFRQELRLAKAMLSWLRKLLRRKGNMLEVPVRRRLEERIEKLGEVLVQPGEDHRALWDERKRCEMFVEDHLSRLKKGPTREYIESIGVAVLIALALRAFVIEAFQIPSGSMIPTLRVGDHIFVNKLSYGLRVPFLPQKIFGTKIPAVSWNWDMPSPGDVIVFITPLNEEEDFIKRVVAVAGDTVTVKNGMLSVNGKPCPMDAGVPFKYNALKPDGSFKSIEKTRMFKETLDGYEHNLLRLACSSFSDCTGPTLPECDLVTKHCVPTASTCVHETGLCSQANYGPLVIPEDQVFVMGDNRDNSQDSRVWGTVPKELIKGRAIFIWWSYREKLVQWDRMFTKIQ